ncbi:MAG: DUF1295 domain-containing protein, partial [Clostridia bacterium]|nr:DUF1295 domain-containing protein [Clostridia bacterium]
FIVYVIAAAIGFITYMVQTNLPWWVRLLIADIVATVVTFLFSVLFKNASVYDPYWSVQPAVILIGYAIANGLNPTRTLILIAVTLWAVRLTANWAYTFGDLTHQDWRYTMLKEKTGKFYPLINFLGIHLVPTLVVYACVLPAAFLFQNNFSANAGSFIFFFVSIGATALQTVSDIQMQRFRKRKTGGFIRDGLWKYSRHPNYLGEILMWWGVALSVFSVAPNAWYLLSGAAANTLLFLFVSLPMAEKRQGQKDGFDEYKKQTRLLLPIKK